MILLIDNYDSFSYNLYQLAGSINPDMKVIRNDEMTIDEICALAPASIILSPGPGRPEQAGRCMEIVEKLGGEIPILGVCLGHQAICAAYGATVTYAKQLMHGKQSETTLDLTSELFQGLPETVPVARYHSLAADEATLPETLKVSILSVSSTRIETFVSTSLNSLSRILREVTYLPSLPANGESFTIKFILIVGSSIFTKGSGSICSGSHAVSPMFKSGTPATQIRSPN